MFSQIIPDINESDSPKKILLCNALSSIILYAKPKVYLDIVEKRQRKILQRAASPVCTASTAGLQVITGITPTSYRMVEQLVGEPQRKLLWGGGKKTWDENDNKAQWSKQLIPNIELWVYCQFKTVDGDLTQGLTVHGTFRAYALRLRKDTTNGCFHCRIGNTTYQSIFSCASWITVRRSLNINSAANND